MKKTHLKDIRHWLLLLVGLFCAFPLCADSYTEDGIVYEVYDNTASVIGVKDKSITNVNINSRVAGYDVTSIAPFAFYNCSLLSSINISNSVTSIGDGAFYGCSSLVKIDIPNSVISIGDDAFCACKSLSLINIPNSVISIGNSAFCECSSLTSINLPDSIRSLGTFAFSVCSSLTSISLPDSLRSIGNSAFYLCKSLTSIALPDSVKSIGNSAFYECSSLTSIAIPDSVKRIGHDTFSHCSSLVSIALPDSVMSIGNFAFYECKSLTSIALPDSIVSIGSYAFFNCSSLTSIELPVTPKSRMIDIGDYAFSGCGSLKSITFPPFYAIKLRTGGYAFADIDISIGDYAFTDCKSLELIKFKGYKVPTIGREVFRDVNPYAIVVVPQNTKDAYQLALKDYHFTIYEEGEIKNLLDELIVKANAEIVEDASLYNRIDAEKRASYEEQLAIAQQVLEESTDDCITLDAYTKLNDAYKQMHQALVEVIAGINHIVVTDNADTLRIYDLNGCRINATSTDELPRGIYIINGKKVIKK